MKKKNKQTNINATQRDISSNLAEDFVHAINNNNNTTNTNNLHSVQSTKRKKNDVRRKSRSSIQMQYARPDRTASRRTM